MTESCRFDTTFLLNENIKLFQPVNISSQLFIIVKMSQTIRKYYPNGSIELEYTEVNNIKQGEYKCWIPKGQLIYSVNYIDGLKEDIENRWYDNGQLRSQKAYVNNIQNGLSMFWSESGKLVFKCNYLNGLKDGDEECWYENGQLESKKNYVNGVLGDTEIWYENGQMKIQKSAINKTKLRWYENGNLECERTFSQNKLTERTWYSNGQLKYIINYENEKKVGENKRWHNNGKLHVHNMYLNDVPIYSKKLDENEKSYFYKY